MDLKKGIVKISTQKSVGTGFIVEKSGIIFTCFHIIRDILDGNDDENYVEVYNDQTGQFDDPKYKFTVLFPSTDDVSYEHDFAIIQIMNKNSIEFASAPINLEKVNAFDEKSPLKVVGLSGKYKWKKLKTKNGKLLDFIIHNKSKCLHLKVNITRGMSGGPVYSSISRSIVGLSLKQTPDLISTKIRGYLKVDIESIAITMRQIHQIIEEQTTLSVNIKQKLLNIFPTEDIITTFNQFSMTTYYKALKDNFERSLEFYKNNEPELIKDRKCVKLNFVESEYIEDYEEKIKAIDFLRIKGLIAVMGSMGLGKSIFILEIVEHYISENYTFKKPLFWLEFKNGIEHDNKLSFKKQFAWTCMRSIRNPEFQGEEIESQMIIEVEKFLNKKNKPIIILDGLDEFRGEEEVLKRFINNLRKFSTLIIFGREERIKKLDFKKRSENFYFFNEIYRLTYLDDLIQNQVQTYIINYSNWKKIEEVYLPSIELLRHWAPHGKAPELTYRNPLVLKALLTKPSEKKEILTEYEILEKVSLTTFEWYVGKKLKEPDIKFEFNSRYSSQPEFFELDGKISNRATIKKCLFLMFEDLAIQYRFKEWDEHKIWIPTEGEANLTVELFFNVIKKFQPENPKCYDLEEFFLKILTGTSSFVQFAGKDRYQILPDRMADFFVLNRILRFINSDNSKTNESLYTIIGSILGNSFMYRNIIDMIVEENSKNGLIGEICNLVVEKLDELSDLTILHQLDMDWRDLNYILTNKGKIKWIDSFYIQKKMLDKLNIIKSLKSIDLQYRNLKKVPNIAGLTVLEYLNLSHNKIDSIPNSIGDLKALTSLKMGDNKLKVLPDTIGDLLNLQSLSLYDNQLNSLPESFGSLLNLKYLYLKRNEIVSLPDSIGNLSSLRFFYIGNNCLDQLPNCIKFLNSLIHIDLSGNLLESLPKEIGNLISLKFLYLNRNKLNSIPDTITNLKNLNILNLRNNKLEILPKSIGSLKFLEKLNVSENELENIPNSIGNLRSLKYLNIRKNNIQFLPDSISELNSLEYLDLSFNLINFLPESMESLESLKVLDISDNFIEKLPLFLVKLKSIKKVILSDYSLKIEYGVENNQILSKLEKEGLIKYSDTLESLLPKNLKKFWKEFGKRASNIKVLKKLGLPLLVTFTDLIKFLETDLESIVRAIPSDRFITSSDYSYRSFKIRKKTNGYRKILAPKNNLKFIQQTIYNKMLLKIIPSQYAHGFRLKHSIVTNAKIHLNAKAIYNLDIKNFFPSIKFDKVLSFFKNIGYSGLISFILSLLCTVPPRYYSKKEKKWGLSFSSFHYLPQGAPTSPCLSNLVCAKMDKELSSISKKYGYRFSRYADDLTFSSETQNKINSEFRRKIFQCINRNGFEVNLKKEKYSKHFKPMKVTGLIIHDNHLTLPRRFIKNLRVALYQLRNLEFDMRMDEIYSEIKNIEGRCSYALMVNKDKYLKYYEDFKKITAKFKNIVR